MSTTPLDRRRIAPRRLGAIAVVYGVFVVGWYVGQPVIPECQVDEAAIDRSAEQYGAEPPFVPTPTANPAATVGPTPATIPSAAPSAYPDFEAAGVSTTMSVVITYSAVACTDDTGERPRLRAWLDGHWL